KLAGIGLGAMTFDPFERISLSQLPYIQFPTGERLGRVSIFPDFFFTEIKSKPDAYSATVRKVADDEIVQWLREVIGTEIYSVDTTVIQGPSKTWVETPEGYIYGPHLQPVRNLPNNLITAIPDGKPGIWAEVTVPYVDMIVANPPLRSPSFRYTVEQGQIPRLYYSQVIWIDQIRTDDGGRILYRFNEDFGHGYGYGDIFWLDGAALRILTPEDTAPISPDVDPGQKTIIVNAYYQTLSCYEGNNEVYFCKVSTGAGELITPIATMYAWRKMYSINMSASATQNGSGYDTSAVSWPTFINGDGVAIHGTFWHNYFGTRRSHGCINARPEDAKWIFRWTTPYVSLEQTEIKMEWPVVGTQVIVREPSL
ncbi:MAG: L,D-transpeptidase, partial [Anaerolineae bacterium]|nr:L,D-transpeptidase [Anaerolineae bacterium]